MEDSFEIGTIKETNEEYFLENDENQDFRKPNQRYQSKPQSKQSSHKPLSEGQNVLKDRTNKVQDHRFNDHKGYKSKLSDEKTRKSHQKHQLSSKHRDEESLSSLSGFSGSDNDEKYKHSPDQQFGNEYDHDQDEEEDEEEEEIVQQPKKTKEQELNERFRHYEELRKRAEEERRIAEESGQIQSKYKRPQTAQGGENRDIRSSNTNLRYDQRQTFSRPQTANPFAQNQGEEESAPILFKPVYTKPYNQYLIEKKVFNYNIKGFRTIPKKSDPVSRINAFKNEWNKTKFLKNNKTLLSGRTLVSSTEARTIYAKTSTKKF